MRDIEAVAVIVYGVLAILLLFVLSTQTGSFWGCALSVVAAGLTYLFQAVQLQVPRTAKSAPVLNFMEVLPVLVFAVAFVLAILGI